MQNAAGCRTGSGDIAAVLGNLRLHQYNIEHFYHLTDPLQPSGILPKRSPCYSMTIFPLNQPQNSEKCEFSYNPHKK
jgi:hypothetical protein